MTNPTRFRTRMLASARACACNALLLAGFGLLAQAAMAQTNIVGNGGFESPSVVNAASFDTWGPGSALAPWVIAGDSIDHIKGYWQPAEGSQSVDLDGNRPGSISQVLSTEVGRTYKLRFKYAANPDRWSDGSRRNVAPALTVRWGPHPAGPYSLQQQVAYTVGPGSSTFANMNWQTAEMTVVATSSLTVLSFTSDNDPGSAVGLALDDVSVTLLVDAPRLLQVYEVTGGAYVIGLSNGLPATPISLQAYSAPTCVDGVLGGGGGAVGAPVPATTDASGYFGATVNGVPLGDFVAIQLTSPTVSARSACVISTGNNDYWPKALDLGSSSTVRDYIDTAGKTRWYKVKVTPGQRIQVTLSGLPADYDLAVFRDIASAFKAQLAPDNAADLTKLSAEYAPSVFSPSVFSPSVFSPSVFSPEAYTPSVFSPSVFSPSVFSPSVFSPSVFSPSVFSPSVFSPSVFSPSVFSPSVFSPSVFSPSVFSPSVFSPADVEQAFSSAQTRSIIGVSATPGTGDETVVVNSWNNNEDFYIRVAGRGGAFSTASQFTVTVTKGATSCNAVTDTSITSRAPAAAGGFAGGYKTVVLTDSSRVALGDTLPGGGTLAGKLATFIARPEVAGALVDVATDARVGQLKLQAANNVLCPYATNLVAEEIKGIVDSYRKYNPGLRYVVIAGNDGAIPFFRYPDQSLLGQESGYVPPMKSDSASDASLRGDYILSQDAYGAGTRISVRTSAFPVPGLAVGRLVETPAEMAGLIDAYTVANGTVTPRTSLVTGYDFLEDAANLVKGEFDAGTGVFGDSLIAANSISPQDPNAWTAAHLKARLLGPARHDIVFLAGHFSANSALAADFATSLITTDLATATTDFTNAIVMSAGCHSGYNIVDADVIPGVTLPLDWAQAFAQKKATLIAGTGYQYGDTDFLEYSERLYANLAKQLRAGTGPVPVGEALVKAKLDYLAATPDIRGIHEKALLEATLFGLPMMAVNMPAGRTPPPAPPGTITPVPVASGPGLALGLSTYDFGATPALTDRSLGLKNVQDNSTLNASWLSGSDGVVSNPAEPALPLAAYDVTSTVGNTVLRGVGFRGGTYIDSTIVPLTGAPTTELRGVHVPFVSPVFYPMRPWTINYFGALSGNGGTRLLVTPAQHRAADIAAGTSTQRKFTHLDLRLFYSANYAQANLKASLSDAPTIVAVDARAAAAGVDFTAQVVGDPAAAVHQVWITYTDGGGTWLPLDLAQCVAPLPAACGVTEDSRLWKGRLDSPPATFVYVVQAASGTGLVSLDDNRGAYYGYNGVAPPPVLAGTTLVLVAAPSSATFGDTVRITAELQSAGTPVSGGIVTISVGGAAKVGATGADGRVTLDVPVTVAPGGYQVVASFTGNATLASSSSSGAFNVGRAPTSLTALAAPAAGATLIATIGATPQPLLQEAVTFSLSGPVGARTVVVNTDYLGRATLPTTGLPGGTYSGTAAFAGNATYAPASVTLPGFIVKAAQSINPLVTTPASPVFAVNGTFTVTATATSGLPVTISSQSPAICTAGGTIGTTVAMLAQGMCTLAADQAGNDYYFPASQVIQPVNIGKGVQTITFAGPGNQTLGTPPIALVGSATSGLPVAFAATGSCSVSGSTLTLAATGSCTITASQAGNATWNPAPDVVRTIQIDLANVWVPAAGRMTTPRSHHTATRFETGPLAGWVLIAGGVDEKGKPTASAELYNPATRTFIAAGKLKGKSSDHTATLLQDGRVLVVGGGNASAELFDPATKTWSAAGGTGSNRSMHTATRLPDGRVLFVGGADNSGKTLKTTIVYNPAGGGSFTSGPSMDTARERHTATLLTTGPNAGKVLIVGGRYSSGNNYVVPATYQLCDATACTLSQGGIGARHKHAAVALVASDGATKVLVAGGKDGSNLLATAEIYDVATGSWSNTGLGTLTPARKALTLSQLPNGRALAAGGRGKVPANTPGRPLPSVDVYSPPAAVAAPMAIARSWHTATPLTDASGNVKGVLIVGGKSGVSDDSDDDDDALSSVDSAEIYGTP